MVVMPGGVDIHSHVAGASVNLARRLLPEEHDADPAPRPDLLDGEPLARSGTGGTVPTTFTTGYRYAGLGYTTVFDAAVAPLTARLSHAELDDTPIVDAGFFVLMGNDDYLLRLIDAGETGGRARLRGVAAWRRWRLRDQGRQPRRHRAVEAREPRPHRARHADRVQPRDAARDSRDAGRRGEPASPAARRPHPLQQPRASPATSPPRSTACARSTGDARTSRICSSTATARDADGGWRSGAREVIEYINAHPHVSGDVGQVMFGAATTLTADGPVEYLLHKSSGRKWVNVDVELETGCGIVPVHLQGEGGDCRAAVGRRPRAVPAVRRSVARRALDRSSERRVVHVVPGTDSAADGSGVSR